MIRLSIEHRFLLLLLFFLTESCTPDPSGELSDAVVPTQDPTLLVWIPDYSASYAYAPDTAEARKLLRELTRLGPLTVAVLPILGVHSADQVPYRTDFTPGQIQIDQTTELSFADVIRNRKAATNLVAGEEKRFAAFAGNVLAEISCGEAASAATSDVDGVFTLLSTLLGQPEFDDYARTIVIVCSDLEHDLGRPRPMQPARFPPPDFLFLVRPKYHDPSFFPDAEPIELTSFQAVSILSPLKP